jgi:hypothetical protein
MLELQKQLFWDEFLHYWPGASTHNPNGPGPYEPEKRSCGDLSNKPCRHTPGCSSCSEDFEMPSPQKFCKACKGKGSTNQKDAPCIEQRENCILKIVEELCNELFSLPGIDEPCTDLLALIKGELDGIDWRNIARGALIDRVLDIIVNYFKNLIDDAKILLKLLGRLTKVKDAIAFTHRIGCCWYNNKRCLSYVDQGGCMTEGNGGGPQTWKDICNPGFVGPVDVR